jgi:hypothetical protein
MNRRNGGSSSDVGVDMTSGFLNRGLTGINGDEILANIKEKM